MTGNAPTAWFTPPVVPRAVVPEGEVPLCIKVDDLDVTSQFLQLAIGHDIDWQLVLYRAWANLSTEQRDDFLGQIDNLMAWAGGRAKRWRAIRERYHARQRQRLTEASERATLCPSEP